ncbi:EAL domain-containing protein [Alishewanella sp. d11]|uniref:EAL domain-containing protein n=1 Tax=Alishewanella sp. d11 TaxID=3414030 RepID=UPI003BF915E6
MPYVLFFIVFMAFYWLWTYIEAIDEKASVSRLNTITQQLTSNLEVFSADRLRALTQLRQSIDGVYQDDQQAQLQLAQILLNALPGIGEISLIDNQNQVIWSTSGSIYSDSPPFDTASMEREYQTAKPAITTLTKGYYLPDSTELWLVIYSKTANTSSFLIAEFELPKILGAFLIDLDVQNLAYALRDQNDFLTYRTSLNFLPLTVSGNINFAGRSWQLTIWSSLASKEWRGFFLLISFIVSVAIAYLAHIARKNKNKQKLSDKKYQRLIENIENSFFYSKTLSGHFNFLSESVLKVTGYTQSEFKEYFTVFSKPYEYGVLDISESFKHSTSSKRYLMQVECKNATLKIIEFQEKNIKNSHSDIISIEGIARDITSEIQFQTKINYQADHDQLTGLYNRYAFNRLLAKLQDIEATFCYIDLDKFKAVNDSCGHHAGDKLLKSVASILSLSAQKDDILARVGGDEFTLIMREVDPNIVKQRLTTLIRAIGDIRFTWEDKVFSIGASIGAISFKAGQVDTQTLVQAADFFCYTAKSKGSNRFHIGSLGDMLDLNQISNELSISELLRKAIKDNLFELYFQLIQPLNAAEGLYYEVLLRLKDHQGQPISPAIFIPVAERFGLMLEIDRWVFDHTLLFLAANPTHQAQLNRCSINLSGQSVGDTDLLAHIIDGLKLHNISPEKICFEITETSVVANLAVASSFITKLRHLGCFFALDDFGSGMCSFSYLKNLPVDYVKIDGVFVKHIAQDKADLAMVKAIHEIVTSLGKKTVAEFVSDHETSDIIQALGIHYGQGFHYAKPEPLKFFIDK